MFSRLKVGRFDVADVDPGEARAYVIANHLAPMADDDHHLADTLRGERVQCPVEQRHAADFDEALWNVRSQWLQAVPLAGGKNHRAANGRQSIAGRVRRVVTS